MQKTGQRKFRAWKTTWKLLALSTLALASGGVVVAQAVARFEPRQYVAMMAAQAQQEWNLSNTQKTKIKTILQDAVPRGIAIHDNMKVETATRQAQLQKLYAATRDKVNAVLTPAQREKAAHWQRDAHGRLQQTLVRVAVELKLSPTQQSKLKPIVMKGFSQAQSLRGDMSLTVAQKFVRLQQIRMNTHAEMGKVLTPQQARQLDSMTGAMMAEARHQFALWRDIKN